jgi:hypothetical protein
MAVNSRNAMYTNYGAAHANDYVQRTYKMLLYKNIRRLVILTS